MEVECEAREGHDLHEFLLSLPASDLGFSTGLEFQMIQWSSSAAIKVSISFRPLFK